jgi:hypothetical protein
MLNSLLCYAFHLYTSKPSFDITLLKTPHQNLLGNFKDLSIHKKGDFVLNYVIIADRQLNIDATVIIFRI